MSKRKKKRISPVFKLLLWCLFVLGLYFSFSVGKEIYTTINLKKQIKEVETELVKIQDENNYLKSQKEKLQDPNYVQSYARGNYMLTKEGEQIFYLPKDGEE